MKKALNPITAGYLTLLEWFSAFLVLFAEFLESAFYGSPGSGKTAPRRFHYMDDSTKICDPPYPESTEFPDPPLHHRGPEMNSFGSAFDSYDFYDPYDPCNPCKPYNPHFYGDPLDVTSPYYFFYQEQQQNFIFDPTSPDYYSHTGIDIGRSDPFDSDSSF